LFVLHKLIIAFENIFSVENEGQRRFWLATLFQVCYGGGSRHIILKIKKPKLVKTDLDKPIAELVKKSNHKILGVWTADHAEALCADHSVSWLEPARAWVKSLNQAENLLKSGNKSEMTTFLKQIGSNHILIDKSFSFSPKKPFQILVEPHLWRGEATSSNLHFPNWRCILELARTEFAPRRAVRGSEWAGGAK
jgi:hypothetical protein